MKKHNFKAKTTKSKRKEFDVLVSGFEFEAETVGAAVDAPVLAEVAHDLGQTRGPGIEGAKRCQRQRSNLTLKILTLCAS